MNPLASLRNRVFIASVALAAITIGCAIYLVSARVTQQAETELERGLKEAASLLEQQHSALSELFLLRARLVADLPVLKSAVDTQDAATVRPLASEYQRQLRADILLVTDRNGNLLFGPRDAAALPNHEPIQRALMGHEAAAFAAHRRGVLQIVTVPIFIGLDQPDILGTLSAGFLLDDRRAEEFKRATASDIAFALDNQVRAATVSRTGLHGPAGVPSGVERVTLGDEDYVLTAVPLALPVPAVSSDGPRPFALVLRSRSSQLRALRTIHSSLLAAAGLAVALATLLSYLVARSITTPLGTITASMREMAATGDLTNKIELRGPAWRQDEDARLLAATFNTLTDSIARFQRESAQRERLLALGRLSTVIAHEVRNPLMIIKGALQGLKSQEAAPDVREAAVDIDDQVRRLNRIVNDVLDFARPLRFELAEANLAQICQEAAAAVAQSDRVPAIRVQADTLQLVTDAERLRAALINLLGNARQAALAARAGASGEHSTDIVLSAKRGPAGRVRISIRDFGIGIAPEHVPQVFEPYFTTKRAGTGLGLPIARNIVEGLGGSITVRPESPGTTVEIDLPEISRL